MNCRRNINLPVRCFFNKIDFFKKFSKLKLLAQFNFDGIDFQKIWALISNGEFSFVGSEIRNYAILSGSK